MKRTLILLIIAICAAISGYALAQQVTPSQVDGCIVGTPPTLNAGQATVFRCNTAGQLAVQTNPVPSGATSITASSGNVAAATATATLAAAAAKTTFICGFTATGGGATAAAVVNLTVTNGVSGTMTYTFGAQAGAGVPTPPLVVQFNPCVPANAINTTIVVSMPSLGTGNTNAAVNAWGFQL